jgi:hypothetical protein
MARGKMDFCHYDCRELKWRCCWLCERRVICGLACDKPCPKYEDYMAKEAAKWASSGAASGALTAGRPTEPKPVNGISTVPAVACGRLIFFTAPKTRRSRRSKERNGLVVRPGDPIAEETAVP